MAFLPIFLSVVVVVRNSAHGLSDMLAQSARAIAPLASDYELIVVDNASQDESVSVLKSLTGIDGLPNLQVYALTKEVDSDTAAWVGLENALGDFVAVLDPLDDDIGFLPTMLESAVGGADVVFATNTLKAKQGLAYRTCFAAFNAIYKSFNDIHLAKEAPPYRVLSKRVINFILQHPVPSVAYRYLPATGGFARSNLIYASTPRLRQRKQLSEGFDRGMQLLVSSTRGPMRVVTALSLLGAVSNLLYSIYVIAIAIFKTDVAPGWITLSLQQSGMFLLISLVLLVLGEYILHMMSASNGGPLYHVAQEFNSARMTRHERLNVEGSSTTDPTGERKFAGLGDGVR